MSNFPRVLSKTVDIDDKPTTISLHFFSDRIWLAVSQTGLFGPMISCTLSASKTSNLDDGPSVSAPIKSQILLGDRDDQLVHLFSKMLCNKINMSFYPPLLISISLKRVPGELLQRSPMLKLVDECTGLFNEVGE
ncbi:hypothetical protein P9112_011211 [Eukaryota sp. TZLM1-RC]